jgi:predicted nucleic acid-binding protein
MAGEWKRLVKAGRSAGLQLHDAYIAAVMVGHGISSILTLNGKDFKRFQKIKPYAPQTWKEIV